MYKKILVAMALDHGHGVRAMDVARTLRAKDGVIVAVHVIEPIPGFVGNYITPKTTHDIQVMALDGINERIGDKKDAKAVVLSGHPGRTITDYAEEIGADLIIVGSHKPDLTDYLLGSTAARTVRHAPCAVHVLR